MNYLDANFVTALHFYIREQTEIAERIVRRNALPYLLSELTMLECRRAFVFHASGSISQQWSELESLVDCGVWQTEALNWRRISQKASALMEQHSASVKAGTLDTLHIAHALTSGCTHFLSFDSNSQARLLAAKCRLKVLPELNLRERSLLG